MALKEIFNKCFGELQKFFEHDIVELKLQNEICYLPPKTEAGKCPVLCWLSGLTYTEQHFISKSGHHQAASEKGFVFIVSDTNSHSYSIRGEGKNWDFGTCAGFNVDANEDLWKTTQCVLM